MEVIAALSCSEDSASPSQTSPNRSKCRELQTTRSLVSQKRMSQAKSRLQLSRKESHLIKKPKANLADLVAAKISRSQQCYGR